MYGHALGIRFAKNNLPQSRFGVVAGLKVHKRATKRNLIKRRIREALRREYVDRVRGYDVAIVARASALDRSYQQIADELGLLLGRAKILD